MTVFLSCISRMLPEYIRSFFSECVFHVAALAIIIIPETKVDYSHCADIFNLFIFMLPGGRAWMDYGCSIGKEIRPLLRGVATPVGQFSSSFRHACRDFSFSPALCATFHVRPSLTLFLCLYVIFHSCCSRAQVFGKTLVSEFYVS